MRLPERARCRAGDDLWHRYEIVDRIASSPMSSIHKAWDRLDRRFVAVKIAYLLDEDAGREDTNLLRLRREGEVLMRLRHPRVLRAIAAGEVRYDEYAVVTELLEGESLGERIDREERLPAREAVAVAAQTLEALEAVHRAGCVHRDVKPGNLMLTPSGVVLIDFGIVAYVPLGRARRLTMDGTVVGTANYMAPEQCLGARRLDGRADLYALGLTLYRMLTGRRALAGNDAYAAQMAQIEGRPRPFGLAAPQLRLPRRLEEVVMRAIEKRPEDRFRDAAEMREELLAAFP